MPKHQPRCYCDGDTESNRTADQDFSRWLLKPSAPPLYGPSGIPSLAAVFVQFVARLIPLNQLKRR